MPNIQQKDHKCPICSTKLSKHKITPCLADWGYLTTGNDWREEGFYTDNQINRRLNKYRKMINNSMTKFVTIKQMIQRVDKTVEEGWIPQINEWKLVKWFFNEKGVKVKNKYQ